MSDKREKIVDTAIELFSRDGFHATGVDTIVTKSGVTKRTLYHHFNSKDDLIVASLRKQHQLFLKNFSTSVATASKNPKEQLSAVFDVAHTWFSSNNFYGCMFINAISEFSEAECGVREAVQNFKKNIRDLIEEISRKAGVTKPTILSRELALLLEGSIVTAQVSGNPESAKDAKKIAEKLIEDAFKS